jgi:hypothetical protein
VAESVAAETVRSFGVLLDRVLRAERQRVTEAMATLCAAVLASEGTA